MVEVRIPVEKIEEFENSVLKGQLIMNKLRAAGIPVIGILFPIGVSRGSLLSFCDDMFGDMVYRWSETIPE